VRINHPIHSADREAMAELRSMAIHEGHCDVALIREPFDALMEGTPAVDGMEYEVGGVRGWWCRPNDAASGAAERRPPP